MTIDRVSALVQRVRFDGPETATSGCELLMWDGRLDNLGELAMQLPDDTNNHRTPGSVACAAYARDGVAGLNRLVGDWSLVMADWSQQTVVLASDFAGARPLYYLRDRHGLVFARDLDSLVMATGVTDLDEQYVADFIARGGSATRTPYAGIRAVTPGTMVRVSAARISSEAFWTPPVFDTLRYRDARRYDEQFVMLFREAVAVRLSTKQPVMAELSGGLDSSSVVCMASELIRTGAVGAPQLDTISYLHPRSSDRRFVDHVRKATGLNGISLSTADIPLFDHRRSAGVTPLDHCPLHEAAAEAALQRGSATFLTGQGGDLLFGNWLDDSLQLIGHLRRGELRRFGQDVFAWGAATRLPALHLLARLVRASLLRSQHSDHAREATSLLTPALERRYEPFTSWAFGAIERRSHFTGLQNTIHTGTLQPIGRMRALAYTHPCLHRPLVEFLLTVPQDVLCGPGEPRRLMRRALSGLLPPAVRARRSKSLFTSPYFEAFRPFAVELLSGEACQVVDRGWVDGTGLTRQLQQFCAGLAHDEAQLRRILLLEHWLQYHGQHATPRVNTPSREHAISLPSQHHTRGFQPC